MNMTIVVCSWVFCRIYREKLNGRTMVRKNGAQSSLPIPNHQANRKFDGKDSVLLTLYFNMIYMFMQRNEYILLKIECQRMDKLSVCVFVSWQAN